MQIFKKPVFWIVAAVVVVGGVLLYMHYKPKA